MCCLGIAVSGRYTKSLVFSQGICLSRGQWILSKPLFAGSLQAIPPSDFPRVTFMALTATATPCVRTGILHQLKMKSPKWFRSSFNRHNLVYEVQPKKDWSRLSDIIYCLSHNECDTTASYLSTAGIKALTYHASLNDKERSRDRAKVVCATIAFVMGIDKPDVLYAIHKSIHNCYAALSWTATVKWLEIMDVVHMTELRYKSYGEELIPICQSFSDKRLSYLEDKEYTALLNSEKGSEDSPYFSSSIESNGGWMSKSKAEKANTVVEGDLSVDEKSLVQPQAEPEPSSNATPAPL
ncbi:Bloom syndrome protein -like protein [Caligus rogercresseyi]|uniref:Bloom syndrome protein -like protein n=1 Tax=Caligus rogercresseyi TaxID=217165 RepID=A0A7T8GYV5_CALRO|nr:Bloom syndrome protein -like protein [Caligus rogercresseyi]